MFLVSTILLFLFITFLYLFTNNKITKFTNKIYERIFFIIACQTAVHKKCHDKLLTKCPESGRESENTIVSIGIYNLQLEIKRL